MNANKGIWLFVGTLIVELAGKLIEHLIEEGGKE